MVGWLVGWIGGCLDGWLVSLLVGWFDGWFDGRVVGWLVGYLNWGMLWIGRQIFDLLRLHLDSLRWQRQSPVQTQTEKREEHSKNKNQFPVRLKKTGEKI